jgi:hypothetical protein
VTHENSSSRDACGSLSPRAGRGRGEGASPLGAELRRSESWRGPLTLVRSAHSTSPRTRGEVKKELSFPRRRPRPSCADQSHQSFASKKIRGGRAPKGANEWAASADAARAERSALAFRRPTAALTAAPKRRSSVQAALHAMQRAGVTRALASRLSEAPRAPVIMPAGSMPGPPGSGSDEPPPAGTAPAPSVGVTG